MSAVSGTGQAESWLSRNGWLLAATWLVFLVFPWLGIVSDEELTTAEKTIATALVVAFALVYVDGFRRQFVGEQRSARAPSGRAGRDHTGRVHLTALIVIGVVLIAIVGPACLGVLAFVVAFAMFHFRWVTAIVVLVASVATAVLVPLATGSLDDLWFMGLIVGAVGLAAMLIRSVDASQSRQGELRTQLAVSDERNRVARDVHDVLGHSLTAVILKAELCQKLLEGVAVEGTQGGDRLLACRQQLDELQSVSRSALAEIRATVGGLRAANLADEVTVARTVLADAGVELLVTGDVDDVPEAHRPVLAWVVREAVTNVVRHADASHCHIQLGPQPSDEPIVLRVTDDGVGGADASSGPATAGNGLRGVRERIEAAGGELRLRSDRGTTVEVAL